MLKYALIAAAGLGFASATPLAADAAYHPGRHSAVHGGAHVSHRAMIRHRGYAYVGHRGWRHHRRVAVIGYGPRFYRHRVVRYARACPIGYYWNAYYGCISDYDDYYYGPSYGVTFGWYGGHRRHAYYRGRDWDRRGGYRVGGVGPIYGGQTWDRRTNVRVGGVAPAYGGQQWDRRTSVRVGGAGPIYNGPTQYGGRTAATTGSQWSGRVNAPAAGGISGPGVSHDVTGSIRGGGSFAPQGGGGSFGARGGMAGGAPSMSAGGNFGGGAHGGGMSAGGMGGGGGGGGHGGGGRH